MGKAILILLVVMFYFQSYTYVDLSTYQSDEIHVEIKGEVNNPDAYTLAYGSTVSDLIEVADGTKDEADLSDINKNKRLLEGDVIVIPKIEEKEVVLVSINSASLEELMTLPGIGEKTAQRILEYRKTNSFQKIEDIMKIKGIKEKMFEKIKAYICL